MPLQKPDQNGLKELADSLLLELDDAEYALLSKEFDAILEQLNRMVSIEADHVEPTDFVFIPSPEKMSRLRLDAPSDRAFTIGDMAANTPYILNGLLLVGEGK